VNRTSSITSPTHGVVDAAAGVTTVLIDRGYGENLTMAPDHTASNLLCATQWIEENIGRDSR
jgi:hypothetical protein